MPARSQTTPLPSRPPSTDVTLSQDSAFPLFPTTRARSVTPTVPSDVKTSFPNPQSQPIRMTGPEIDLPPASPRIVGAGSMLQRMNSIAPGPFNVKSNEEGESRISAHRESPSLGGSKDVVRPSSSGSAMSHAPRPSASSSVYTRMRSTSTVSGVSRYDWDAPGVPEVPAVPRQPERPLHITQDTLVDTHKNAFDFGPTIQPARSEKFPSEEPSSSHQAQGSHSGSPIEPSPYSHKPRPSVAAAMQPLHEIGSASSFKPSRSIKGRSPSQGINRPAFRGTDNDPARDDKRLQDVPPVPASFRRAYHDESSPSYNPHESTSSNGSSTSGARSGSSASSPPLQESPQRRRPAPSDDSTRADNMFNDFKFGIENRIQSEESLSHRVAPSREPESYNPQFPLEAPPASAQPTLPNLHTLEPPAQQNTSPLISPDDLLISSPDPRSDSLHLSPAPVLSPPAPISPNRPPHRSRPPDKGPCRGCGDPIKGKSVSSADGRLTGRYHKACFVCNTCQNAFQTADFYVIRNHPYCGRHYHELNDSLCQGCDRGIEGQYLETDSRRKFHSYCFTCQDCHRILRDDYYEWNGRRLCEQHAFRAAQQPSSSLGIGGRKFPERRTTKLMMM